MWTSVVILGFVGAGYLIGKSYYEWQESPISTSITTKPIDDLDFPVVSICPPRGSHTALYHDLVNVGNGSLTERDKHVLNESAHEIFIKGAPQIHSLWHKDYVAKMKAITNKQNIE